MVIRIGAGEVQNTCGGWCHLREYKIATGDMRVPSEACGCAISAERHNGEPLYTEEPVPRRVACITVSAVLAMFRGSGLLADVAVLAAGF